MIEVHLRWIMSQSEDYPFCYTVSEETTVEELCKMVKDQNNFWLGNPTFSIVKLREKGLFLDDKKPISSFENKDGVLYLDFYAG
jgi:hypothetical protein